MGEYLDSWLTSYADISTGPRTAEGYASKLRLHIIPHLGKVPMRTLEPSAIQAVYKALMNGHLSARSVLSAHTILKEALEHAVSQGFIARNPCLAVIPPRPARRELHWLNVLELQRVLDEAKSTPYYAAVYTALFTGLRRGELLGLRLRDVDLTLGTVQVSRSLNTLSGRGSVFSDPKSDKGGRLVALAPSNSIVLRSQLEKLKADMNLLGVEMTLDTQLFSRPDGRPLLPSALTHNWIKIVRRADLHGVHLHDARHTHATLMLAQNVHPKIVQERLGHSTISITLDTYSHVIPGLQTAAALGFDNAVGSHSELAIAETR